MSIISQAQVMALFKSFRVVSLLLLGLGLLLGLSWRETLSSTNVALSSSLQGYSNKYSQNRDFLPSRKKPPGKEENSTTSSMAIVVATLQTENTSWIDGLGWDVWRYEVDNPKAKLTVPSNKGHEAMVYLTHIINQYDNLTDTSIFIHANRYQWHNDDPNYDGLAVLQNLNLPTITKKGYVSLRCHFFPGCPLALIPEPNSQRPSTHGFFKKGHMALVTHIYSTAFPIFFPSLDLPTKVAAPCCSQFGVSKAAILSNPKSTYERIQKWLVETEEEDYYTGRVMEYIWHILFGQEAVSCPGVEQCYCEVFEMCGLKCDEARGDCGVYFFPLGWQGWFWKWKGRLERLWSGSGESVLEF